MRKMHEEEARRHFPDEVREDVVRQARGEVTMREILEGDAGMTRAQADKAMSEFKDYAEKIGRPVDTRDGEIVLEYAPADFLIEDGR